jgi:hypothetical protein
MSCWTLIIYFSCAVGCGEPASVALPVAYATEQGCTDAGNVWLSRNANPMRTVASFACNYVAPAGLSYRFRPEQYQE